MQLLLNKYIVKVNSLLFFGLPERLADGSGVHREYALPGKQGVLKADFRAASTQLICQPLLLYILLSN